MKQVLICCCFILIYQFTVAQSLRVSDNGRFLVYEDGTPFFWLADTAWEMLHRCDREEIKMYLDKRQEQGFNVVQTVALAELDGLNTPNSYGNTPLLDNNPATPNADYFEHVDFAIEEAKKREMFIALLPTWGDKLNTKSWGIGPEVFTVENAKAFGQWIGNRYKDCDNIVWVIGGDRNPREDSQDVEVWRAMANGILESVGGNDKALMTYHPQPKEKGGSSTWFHQDEWLDFNMHQTGHCANQGTYEHIEHDYNLTPTKPTIDGEPLYEDHPNCFNAKELGHSVARDIRRIMYWNVFAGGFGQTYGCHDVWQMYDVDKEGINYPLRPWKEALNLPMATQVKHLKHLMLSRPFLTRVPDQNMVVKEQTYSENYVSATRDETGSYAMIYLPTGSSTTLDLSSLAGKKFNTWWYDVRTGASWEGEQLKKEKTVTVKPPTSGAGNDWVLVIDAKKSDFTAPGKPMKSNMK
jgi:hypothetical protein